VVESEIAEAKGKHQIQERAPHIKGLVDLEIAGQGVKLQN
jgi:hypothetical protein